MLFEGDETLDAGDASQGMGLVARHQVAVGAGDRVRVTLTSTAFDPVLLVTLSVDIMLAIVNRAAQQSPVFQLSFGLKPAIGMAVLLISLPTMVEMIIHFFEDHQRLF